MSARLTAEDLENALATANSSDIVAIISMLSTLMATQPGNLSIAEILMGMNKNYSLLPVAGVLSYAAFRLSFPNVHDQIDGMDNTIEDCESMLLNLRARESGKDLQK